MTPRVAKSHGFTMVEVMVAVALLAMLGIIISTAMTSILGAIQDTKTMQEYYHTARVALGRMEREIGMAYVSKHQSEFRTTKTEFVGKGNTITFTYMGHRRMVRNAHESDEGVIEYKLERDKEGGNVLVRREKTVIDASPQKGGQRQVLAHGVKSIRFAYWDMDKEAWQSDWRVEIDNVLEEQQKKALAATAATAAVGGNADLGKALAAVKPPENAHGPDDFWLPARVKITMVLETEDGDLTFETQTRVRLMEPLDFNGVFVPKPFENTLNPYAAVPAQTPTNFSAQPAMPGGPLTPPPRPLP
jgi:type II secretion system protein J